MDVMKKDGVPEELMSIILENTFYMLKQYKIMKIMIDNNLVDILLQILDFVSYSGAIAV
jgi:hypothetical protein